MANQTLLKKINRARVLNAIRLHSPLSRSDIAEMASLDRKSVTNVVSDLFEQEIVTEVGRRRSGKGRPFVLLEFRKNRHLVMGISIFEENVTAVLLNLYGEVLAVHEVDYSPDSKLERILGAVRRTYEQLRSVADSHLKGVGVAVPGIIDLKTGLVHHSVNIPALEQVNVRDAVGGFDEEPLFVEEGSRAKALAEKWFGHGRDASSFVCVDLGIGIGVGIVHEGRLFAGGKGYAGEIGHVRIEKDGRACRCGNRGCLEAYVSDRVLLAEINEATGASFGDLDDVRDSRPAVRGILGEAGYRLGVALSHVVNLICPPVIVINGKLMRCSDVVMPGIERGITECALKGCLEGTSIRVSELSNAAALGAATAVLSGYFEVEGHFYV